MIGLIPNTIITLLQSRIFLLKILNCRLVNTGNSLFNLQRVDFFTHLSLSSRHFWSSNTFLFSGPPFYLHIPSNRVITFFSNIQAGISPPCSSSLSLSLLPPLGLALTPGWSTALQSGSGS